MEVRLSLFQEEALDKLWTRVRNASTIASGTYQNEKRSQVISFSAPTGSGKTIIMASLIESILFGGDKQHPEYEPRPHSIFVWLSDSPELNEQSREKIESRANRIPKGRCVTIEDESFNKEILEDGHIYFLNTQKLGECGNLTKRGEGRAFTIWKTLTKTAEKKRGDLYFIIDEAHRGAKSNKATLTIMQKFLKGGDKNKKGSDEAKFPPMPVVIGMSATADRFRELVKGLPSTLNEDDDIKVDPAKVRRSGLLKDHIVFAHKTDSIGDDRMAILQEAVKDWKEKCEQWRQYCEKQQPPCEVNPVFVIQVENKDAAEITASDIGSCLRRIEECLGESLKPGEVVHAFGEKEAIEANNLKIPYKKPSHISEDQKIKIVFFKEGLSTGWDCPRAETMLSFRSKEDPTSIAQLVGRIVRTPLHKKIEENDILNNVHLYLPYFNRVTVQKVIDELGDIPTNFETRPTVTLTIHTKTRGEVGINREEVVRLINDAAIPSYKIQNHGLRISDFRGMFYMANILVLSGTRVSAADDIRNEIVQRIHEYIETKKKSGEYDDLVRRVKQGKIRLTNVEYLEKTAGVSSTHYLAVARDDDIEDKFNDAERLLGNEGIGLKYGSDYGNEKDQSDFRIDVIIFANDPNCIEQLNNYASKNCEKLSVECYGNIRKMDKAFREQYNEIASASASVSRHAFELPEAIYIPDHAEGKDYNDHLFVDAETGVAKIELNSWEEVTLDEERNRSKGDFVCWARNIPNASWALAIPYDSVDAKTGKTEKNLAYPDFIIVRKDASLGYVVDLLEPHGDNLADSLDKAKGLAEYAKHCAQEKQPLIGRIQQIRVKETTDGDRARRIDMSDEAVREKVLQAKTLDELTQIYIDHGFYESTTY